MADITFISATISKSSDAKVTHAMTMPSSRPDGDVYVALVAKDDDVAFSTTLAEKGWTQIIDQNEGGSAGPRVGLYYKKGNSEPASYNIGGDSEEWATIVMRFNGASTTLVNAVATTQYATDRRPEFPAITPTTNRTFILRVFGIDADTPTTAQVPAGHTNIGVVNAGLQIGAAVVYVTSARLKNVAVAATTWGVGVSDTYVASSIALAPTPTRNITAKSAIIQ